MPSSVNLNEIARNLARIIPKPYKKAPTVQQSWRALKQGQWLSSRVTVLIRNTGYPAGTLWQVMTTTDMGVTLVPRQGSGVLVWSDPDWQSKFNRARKPKAMKA